MMRAKTVMAILGLLVMIPLSGAGATTWQYPDETHLTDAYNALYGTNYSDDMEGLLGAGLNWSSSDSGYLLGDYGQKSWTGVFNTAEQESVLVLAYDSAGTSPLGIWYDDGSNTFSNFYQLYDPGTWTSPSRGWVNDPSDQSAWQVVDLVQAVGEGVSFKFGLKNGITFFSENSVLVRGSSGDGFLLGYNEGGFSSDKDFNEPLVYVNPVPVPGAVWLLGSGLLGLVGFRRRWARRQ